jgi:hypothetical protein
MKFDLKSNDSWGQPFLAQSCLAMNFPSTSFLENGLGTSDQKKESTSEVVAAM